MSDAKFVDGQLTKEVIVKSGWSSKELLLQFIDNNFNPVVDSKGQKTRFEVTVKGAIEAIKERSEIQSHVISVLNGLGGSQKAQSELEELGIIFDDYPKPTSLIDYFIRMQDGNDFIVLDFFSGSGTTAHSVYKVSALDNKKIRFISVQLPEPTKADSKARKAGLLSISDIARKRITLAGEKFKSEVQGQLSLRGTHDIDFGFKCLNLNQSNFKPWQALATDICDEELLKQMELNVDHIDPNAEQEDILYELIIKAGVMPTEKIEKIELAGQNVFSVADKILLVHLQDEINQAVIDEVVKLQPQQFICLDRAFHGNDQLKTNAVKTFEAFNQGKEKIDQISFKTV